MQNVTEKTILEGIQSIRLTEPQGWTLAQLMLADGLNVDTLDLLEVDDHWVAPADVHWLWDSLERFESGELDAPPPVYCPKELCEQTEALLLEHWGDFSAFDGPGEVADQAELLLGRFDFVGEDEAIDKRLVYGLKANLQDHLDPERVELPPVEEFKAWLVLEREQLNVAYETKDPEDRPEKRRYLSCVETLEWFQAGAPPALRESEVEVSEAQYEEAHQMIRRMVEQGESEAAIQQEINSLVHFNQAGLSRYAERCREDLERNQDILDALEDLLLRGQPPAIDLADYLPADWAPMFKVLQNGLKFTDEAIVMTVMAAVAAMLPPQVRVRAWSMEEIPTVWLFLIGSSGTAKSVLLRTLITAPMDKPIEHVDWLNDQDRLAREVATDGDDNLPPSRKRNLIYTAPSTQGIRADLAAHGAEIPGLLVRDELNGWLKQMADEGGMGVGDVEFWLSSYDGAYSNDVFADARKSREVRHGKLGVVGGIQPKVFLEQLESGNANGFNSRPLFVHVPRIRREMVRMPEETKQEMQDRLGGLYLKALQFEHQVFQLSEEAEEMFRQLFDQLEDLSLSANSEEVEALWAKGPGQVLRMVAAVHFVRVATGKEELVMRGFSSRQAVVVSTRSLQLAANLVMAGKTRAVELHERAANPMLEQADKLLEHARKRQGKHPDKGVALSVIRKAGWSAANRPTLAELKQMAHMLQSRGLVRVLNKGTSIWVVR